LGESSNKVEVTAAISDDQRSVAARLNAIMASFSFSLFTAGEPIGGAMQPAPRLGRRITGVCRSAVKKRAAVAVGQKTKGRSTAS